MGYQLDGENITSFGSGGCGGQFDHCVFAINFVARRSCSLHHKVSEKKRLQINGVEAKLNYSPYEM